MAAVNATLKSFRDQLRAAGKPERAEKEKAYLKSPYKFFGASLPAINGVAKEFRKAHKDIARSDLFAMVEKLWASEYHEEKSLSIKLLAENPRHLDIEAMPFLERMLSECTGWDHTDEIAIHLVGEVLAKDRKAYDYLKIWSKHESHWMRRASLIAQVLLFRKGRGDRKLFFRLARPMAGEKEFFIRKAIGWAVREISKADRDIAYNFLMELRDTASGLTLREGSKLMPDEMRKSVLAGGVRR
jgi:3-methyladenine DNA glycosylase AlkD